MSQDSQDGGADKKEQNLFRQAMGDVRPLSVKRQASVQKKDSYPRETYELRRRLASRSIMEKDTQILSDHAELVQPEESLEYVRCGSSSIGKNMRSGKIDIEAYFDMHGHNVNQARNNLIDFISHACEHYYRYVKVIHGKAHMSYQQKKKMGARDESGLTLKSLANAWLKQIPQVVAFVSCRPADGGTGAVYVRLSSDDS